MSATERDNESTTVVKNDDEEPESKRMKLEEEIKDDGGAGDLTALAANIAARLVKEEELSSVMMEDVVVVKTEETTTQNNTDSKDESDHEEQKDRKLYEIQAALEKVKEDNLKKEPSISTLVTEGLWHDDAQEVEDALTELANLSYGNPNAGPNRVTISLTGGLLAIVKALKRFPLEPDLQAAGGRALQNLALDQNNKSAIAGAGGIEILVQAMKDFPSHVGVQMGGCGTFQNLVWGNDDNRMRIYKAGGIPVIIQAMQIHGQSSAELVEWACGAIYLLAIGEREVKEALFESKALTAVADALENHRGDGSILEKGRNALARLLWQ